MLVFGSKTITVDGITVYADHADPNQFWYLPGPVKLGRREDNQASFVFIKYKPAVVEAGVKGGGFLMFDVNLQLERSLEQKILSQLSAIAPDRPKLAAVPFDEGTVQCIALNLQGSGGTTATATPGTFNAVEKILGASVPSLDAKNAASFSLTLSQEGAIILEKAFQQGTTPIGALYNLKYTGLRPALDVKITADLKRVYTQFSASLEGQYYFFKVGIEAAFEKLVQEGAIQIEVINFSGADDRVDKEKQAIEFFRDHLLRDWFVPTLAPGQPTGGIPTPPTGNPPVSNPSDPPVGNPPVGNPNPPGENPTSGGENSGSNGGISPAISPVISPAKEPVGVASRLHHTVSFRDISTQTDPAPATLEILRRAPDPLPAGYGLQHTSTTGTTETLTVLGGANPVVRVNGQVQTLDANRQFTVDVTSNNPANIVVEYPRATRTETFHLYFDFELPRESGWSTASPVYRSYLGLAEKVFYEFLEG